MSIQVDMASSNLSICKGMKLLRVSRKHVTKLSDLYKNYLKQAKSSVRYLQVWGHSKRQIQTQSVQDFARHKVFPTANEQNCIEI